MPFRIASRPPLKFFVLALALLLGAACGGKRPPALATAQPGAGGSDHASSDSAGRNRAQPVDSGPDLRAIQNESATGSDLSGGAVSGEGGPLADIHFELDSAALTKRRARRSTSTRRGCRASAAPT